ncbi:MAG: DUF6503 family protein [Acidobacteriota bacterium]
MPRIFVAGVFALAVTVSPLAASASDASMPEIVARSIEAHGGDAFLHSTVRYELCSKSGCSQVIVERDGGLFTHDVTTPSDDGSLRIEATNDTVRIWRGGVEQAIEPGDAQRWRDQATARIYHVFLPFKLGDPSVRFEDQGLETWSDGPLHRIAVRFEPGSSTDAEDQMLFWFDPESAHLVQFAYSYHDPDGLRFRRLHNPRRVGGLLFHDQENLGWDGPGLTIDALGPDTVDRLREVSSVDVRSLEVEASQAP